MKLPDAYEKRMRTLLKDAYPAYLSALDSPPVRGFRVNTEKISPEDFLKIWPYGAEPIPYVPTGFYLTEEHIGHTPFHHAGMLYIQEPAAQAPVACLSVKEGDWVLDLCAAPGGKSTQVKNKLGADGVLVANEIVAGRCRILTGNIERLGFQNTVTTCLSPQRVAEVFPYTFDLVIVDAPCSGEGMFRKEPDALTMWSEENVALSATRQREILDCAARAVKPGGQILYATCTFSPEEDERVVDGFLARHGNFRLCPVPEAVRKYTEDGVPFFGCVTENLTDARRFYPHTGRGEGQFMAVLQNTDEGDGVHKKAPPIPKETNPAVFAFLDEVLTDYKREYVLSYGGQPVYFTDDFPVPSGVSYSLGVRIGEVKKNYILPHHQFFMALGKRFRHKLPLSPDSDALRRYLHGEEIDAPLPDGWAAVTVAGAAVGGIKVVGGRGKNHYPKGLRT